MKGSLITTIKCLVCKPLKIKKKKKTSKLQEYLFSWQPEIFVVYKETILIDLTICDNFCGLNRSVACFEINYSASFFFLSTFTQFVLI